MRDLEAGVVARCNDAHQLQSILHLSRHHYSAPTTNTVIHTNIHSKNYKNLQAIILLILPNILKNRISREIFVEKRGRTMNHLQKINNMNFKQLKCLSR